MNKVRVSLLTSALVSACVFSAVCPPASQPAEVSDGTTSGAKADAGKATAEPPPFKVAGKVSRTLQTVTGLNLLASVVAGQTAKTVLKKKLGGDVKVKVKLYSFTDLLSGKIKSVDCSLDGSKIKGVSVGRVNATTNQPIWLDLHDKRHIQLKTPVLVSVKAAVSQDEVSAALKSERVAKSLRGLNLDLPGLGAQQLQVVNPKVTFVEDTICIDGLLKSEGADDSTGVPLKITGKLKLKGDDRIEIADMKVESSDIIEPEKFATFVEELLNPLIDLKRMDRKDHAFRLTSLDVGKDGLTGEGRLVIAPKNPPAASSAPVKQTALPAAANTQQTPKGNPGLATVEQKTK